MVRRSLLLFLAFLPACGALLGIKDLTAPDDGTAQEGGTDGGPLSDAPSGDGPSADTGPCGDTTQSAENCGRCRHSCLGGMCVASTCQPTPLAADQGEVSGIAIDATYVYFASFTANLVSRVPKAGGAVQPIATTGVEFTRHIAVNATHVFWSAGDSPGTVSRCAVTGCVGAPEIMANPDRPMGIALDDQFVYWADRNDSALRRKPLAGGAEQHYSDTLNGLPIAIAVGGNAAFSLIDFTGEVDRHELADGAAVVVGNSGADGRDLTLDSAFVYWGAGVALGQDGHIARAPRTASGGVTLVGSAGGEPVALTTDEDKVYWTAWARTADGGVTSAALYSCPKTGCGTSRVTVAANQELPRGIAVDDDAIYFGGAAGVMKLAKP